MNPPAVTCRLLDRRLSRACPRVAQVARLALLIALVTMLVHRPAQAATLRLGSGPGFPGQTTTVPMELAAGTNLPPQVIALQADLIFETSRIAGRTPAGGSALRGHRMASREPTNGVRRVVLYSPNNTAMTNGTLLRLPFDVVPTNYLNARLELTNVVLATAAGSQLAVTNFAGVIFLTPVFLGPDGKAEGFLQAAGNERYLVQASGDLITWITISTNEAIGSIIRFLDEDAARFPHRYYRAVLFDATGQFGTITQLPDGRIQFSFTGLAGRSYVIEASTNLVDWLTVGSEIASGGTTLFTNSPGVKPHQFFRLKSSP